MSKLALLKELSFARVLRGLRRRGLRGAWNYGLRRAGAMAETALTGPYMIRINPMGYVCNHTCPMCWLQHLDPEVLKREKKIDREQGMTLADYRRMFDALPAGVEEINMVGGGEPLAHAEAVGIMREIKTRGFRGWLITNGTLMKEETSRAMIDMNWDMVRVSIHAGDAEAYREIQGVDRYEAMKANLKAFDRLRREAGKEKKCRLFTLFVLQHENIQHIERLFQLAAEVGSDFIVLEKIIPYDGGKWLTREEIAGAREQILDCAKRYSVPCNLGEILPELVYEEALIADPQPFRPAKRCSVGFDHVFVTAMGDVMPCCFSNENMGNVRETPFDEIWKSEKYAKFRKRLINGKFPKYCIENRCAQKGVLHN